MKKTVFFAVIIFVLTSCATTSEFQVSRVGEEPEKYNERLVYVLPRTVLEVKLNFEKETYIPGPYRKFSERFLGMTPYITDPGLSYRITDVKINSATEPDPGQYFSVNITKGKFDHTRFLKLSRDGFIMSPYTDFKFESVIPSDQELPGEPYFTDLSVKRNLMEVTDTLYKTMITDSSYVRIPVLRSHREAKTLEQKAEEAANFIIKIRKRRFKLLAGQYDVFPEGKALAISVEELDKLEKEYLELFMGKTVKQSFTRSYVVIPEETSNESNLIVAKFSQQTGLNDPTSDEGRPIVLEIQPQHSLKDLFSVNRSLSAMPAVNNLYYRIPDVAVIKLRIASEVLYESRMSLYQAGGLINIPVVVE